MGKGMSQRGRATLTALGVAFAASGLSGCSAMEPPDTRVAYCVDEQGTVLDEGACDKDDSHYRPGSFIWIGNYPTGMTPGQRINWSDPSYSGQRAQANDSSARSKIGVSESGKVSTGTKGGIGIGKSGGSVAGGKAGAGGAKGGVGGAGGSGS